MHHSKDSQYHKQIICLTILILLMGQVMIFSATGILGLQKYGSEFYYLIRQSTCATAGIGLMIVLSIIPYQVWTRFSPYLLALQILLVSATLFSPFSREALGANRWLEIASFRFQPSEIAKITVSIYLAHLLSKNTINKMSPKAYIFRGVPLLVLLSLIFFQPDLGTTVILCLMIFGLLFIAGMRPLHVVSFFGVGGTLFVISLVQSEYRRRRLFAFLNPWADPQGGGFQSIQSFLSLHSGKILGVGIGNGNSKLFFLPEVHTDFIFSLIGEELGFIGAISILCIFVYFSFLLFKIPPKATDTFGKYLAFTLALSIVLQITINLGGITGLLPVKGLPLPFFSWGRTSLIVNLASIGILLNILKQSELPNDRGASKSITA